MTEMLYHGSRHGIIGSIQPLSRENCDFGQGFYMARSHEQPANLVSSFDDSRLYTLELNMSGLHMLRFGETYEELFDWAMTIAYHRGYLHEVAGTHFYHKYQHFLDGYDIVIGEIGNDKMFQMMTRFFTLDSGAITDVVLFECLRCMGLGEQIVAKTSRACAAIKNVVEVDFPPEERLRMRTTPEYFNQKKSRVEAILLKHRRNMPGFYFDEILERAIKDG